MRTITQRELRNDNARVIRAIEAGESFLVTKNGVSVAVLRPVLASEKSPGLPLGRSARRRDRYVDRPRIVVSVPTAQILDELRQER